MNPGDTPMWKHDIGSIVRILRTRQTHKLVCRNYWSRETFTVYSMESHPQFRYIYKLKNGTGKRMQHEKFYEFELCKLPET